jgi:hypothetical protein
VTPPSLDRHDGAVQIPAPVHATEHGDDVVCHAPAGLHVWGCRGPEHCISFGAQTPVHVPLMQV